MNLNVDINMLRDMLTGDEAYERREIAKFLYRLVEQLKVVLDNLDEENLTTEMTGEWKDRGERLTGAEERLTGAENALAAIGKVKILSASGSAAYRITVPSNSSHLLIITGAGATACAVLQAAATSTGAMAVYRLNKGADLEHSSSTNAVDLTLTASQAVYVQDICLRGGGCSVAAV